MARRRGRAQTPPIPSKALELGEQGMAGDDFRALLEKDEVTATSSNGTATSSNTTPTAPCENVTDGEVSKAALQESVRNDMVFCFLDTNMGNKSTRKMTQPNLG